MQGTLCISTPCETISPDPLQDSLYPALCGIPVLTLRWCSSCPSGPNFLPAWLRPACLLRYHRPAGFPLLHFFFFFTTNACFMRALVLFPMLTLARFSHDRPQLVSQHWKEAFHCRLYKPTDLGGCHRWVVAVLAHPCEGRGNCRRCFFEYVALSTSGSEMLLSCTGAWVLVRMRVVVFGAVQSLAPPQRRLLGVNCV